MHAGSDIHRQHPSLHGIDSRHCIRVNTANVPGKTHAKQGIHHRRIAPILQRVRHGHAIKLQDMQLLCRLVAGLLPVTHHADRHIHALQEKKSGHRHAVSAIVAHTAHHQHFIQAELLCMHCLYRF